MNPFKVLGVEPGTDLDDIKKVYRKLAMKYHPDRNPDNPEAEAKFKEAAEAYAYIVENPNRNVKGSDDLDTNGKWTYSSKNFETVFKDFEDIFKDFDWGNDRFGVFDTLFKDVFGNTWNSKCEDTTSRSKDQKSHKEGKKKSATSGIKDPFSGFGKIKSKKGL